MFVGVCLGWYRVVQHHEGVFLMRGSDRKRSRVEFIQAASTVSMPAFFLGSVLLFYI